MGELMDFINGAVTGEIIGLVIIVGLGVLACQNKDKLPPEFVGGQQ